ncbi:MAG: hypothetical protein HC896_00380 [Bacteroidales bacterium]|nr:hypothetical protein [Bacteroidales bacterium]
MKRVFASLVIITCLMLCNCSAERKICQHARLIIDSVKTFPGMETRYYSHTIGWQYQVEFYSRQQHSVNDTVKI